jgi:hypothetical protein
MMRRPVAGPRPRTAAAAASYARAPAAGAAALLSKASCQSRMYTARLSGSLSTSQASASCVNKGRSHIALCARSR